MSLQQARSAGAARAPGDQEERAQRRSTLERVTRVARGLGWFSVGLGLAQMIAPRTLARLIGVRRGRRDREVMRAIGAREVAAGLGILARRRPAGWVWTRVGGDMMDLALLGSAFKRTRGDQSRLAAATGAVVALTILDTLTGKGLDEGAPKRRALPARERQVTESITVNRPIEDVYRFAREVQNLPRFVAHLDVQTIDERRFRWLAKGPKGTSVAWVVEITEDRPDELFAWRLPGPTKVACEGAARFTRAPGDRGTEIHVEVRYEPPGGRIGALVSKVSTKALRLLVGEHLRRLKQVLETGEVVRSDASVHRGPHAAQPPDEPPPARERDAGLDGPPRGQRGAREILEGGAR